LAANGKAILNAGGKVVEILSTHGFQTAVKADLDAWITTTNLNVTAMIDSPSTPQGALKVATIRETAWIIEMPSMKIVWMRHGDVTGQAAPTIVEAEAQMHTLLGK
jgi:hypothetical protein